MNFRVRIGEKLRLGLVIISATIISLFTGWAWNCTAAPAPIEEPDNYTEIIANLEDQWLVYDDFYHTYVPYLTDRYSAQYILNQAIDASRYQSYHLRLESPQTAYLFVQSQLTGIIKPGKPFLLKIDSLVTIYHKPFLLVTLYSENGFTQLPGARIVYPHDRKASKVPVVRQKQLVIQPRLRESGTVSDFVQVAAIFILAMYAFVWNFHPKAFQKNFSFRRLFSFNMREDTVFVNKPLSPANLLFILIHSFLLSFFYMLIQQSTDEPVANILQMEAGGQFWGAARYFMLMSTVVFLLLLGKYILIYIVGSVFRLTNIINVHYYEYLLFSRLFYTVLVPLHFLIFLSVPLLVSASAHVIIVVVILFNILRIIIINSVLNSLISVKNLYLFSYLCATELVPLLIGIKILMK